MIEQSKHFALAITCGAKRGPKDTDLTFSPASLRDFLKAISEQQDRHTLQANGEHPAPCARHCEANAFQIEIRSLKAKLEHVTYVEAKLKQKNT